MVITDYSSYVRYHDLKSDIYVSICFDSPNDMIEFFHKYNPCSIDIEVCKFNYVNDIYND